jgi:hypothetical protein
MRMYIVHFKQSDVVLQTFALHANSEEHALEQVALRRIEYPEWGVLAAEGEVYAVVEPCRLG